MRGRTDRVVPNSGAVHLHRSSFIVLLLLLACAAPHTHHAPTRVVILAPNLTEMAYAIGAGDLVVGRDDASDFPPQVARVPSVGAGIQPNVEKIVALHPDLVVALAAGLHPNLSRSLEAQHIPLLVIRTERLDQIAGSMMQLGAALHRDAKPAATAMQQALLAQRRTRAKKPRLIFAVWTDPLYIAGRNTFTDDLYQLTGAANAATVTGWPQWSLESLIVERPDLLLYPNRSVSRSQVDALVARVNVAPRVVAVDENVFTRPGPRVAEAAAALNRILDEWER